MGLLIPGNSYFNELIGFHSSAGSLFVYKMNNNFGILHVLGFSIPSLSE